VNRQLRFRPRSLRSGFTLIELLIVVVIIGILAAIALPKFGESRERAFVSAMQSDLRNLQTAMELYYHRNNGGAVLSYSGAALDGAGLLFNPSDEVDIVLNPDHQGWSATADHPGTNVTCAIFVGNAAAVAPATAPEVVACAEP
jgi:type IV pilus assembly protein PilA